MDNECNHFLVSSPKLFIRRLAAQILTLKSCSSALPISNRGFSVLSFKLYWIPKPITFLLVGTKTRKQLLLSAFKSPRSRKRREKGKDSEPTAAAEHISMDAAITISGEHFHITRRTKNDTEVFLVDVFALFLTGFGKS